MQKSLIIISLFLINTCNENISNQENGNKSNDFIITGEGDNKNWGKAEWIELTNYIQFDSLHDKK